MVKRLNYKSLSSFARGRDVVTDAMSRHPPESVDFDEALIAAEMQDQHRKLLEISEDGTVDWSKFDIVDFAVMMPSIAVLDSISDENGQQDFRYGYVGESVNEIAQQPLRGHSLGEVLVGEAKQKIIDEYAAVLRDRTPRASIGRVTVSDGHESVPYMRFLYPVRRGDTIDRVLLFMLFAL